MALDVQRNWTVSMEKNFAKVKMSSAGGRTPQAPAPVSQGDILSAPVSRRHTTRDPVHLPDEIVLHILDYISAAAAAQATFRTYIPSFTGRTSTLSFEPSVHPSMHISGAHRSPN
ncbi:hypothetical protein LTR28_012587 [Elasticomyces elasticus]|nr:hypothetical protein LTR28_012587 [Elasticomyces elasticus]